MITHGPCLCCGRALTRRRQVRIWRMCWRCRIKEAWRTLREWIGDIAACVPWIPMLALYWLTSKERRAVIDRQIERMN